MRNIRSMGGGVVGGSSCAAGAVTIRGDKILWSPVYDAGITITREWQPLCRCHFPQRFILFLLASRPLLLPPQSPLSIDCLSPWLLESPHSPSTSVHLFSLLRAPPSPLAPAAFPFAPQPEGDCPKRFLFEPIIPFGSQQALASPLLSPQYLPILVYGYFVHINVPLSLLLHGLTSLSCLEHKLLKNNKFNDAHTCVGQCNQEYVWCSGAKGTCGTV